VEARKYTNDDFVMEENHFFGNDDYEARLTQEMSTEMEKEPNIMCIEWDD